MSNINKFTQKEGDIFSYDGEKYTVIKHVNADGTPFKFFVGCGNGGCHCCDLRNKSDFSSKYCAKGVEYEGFPHCFRVDQKDEKSPIEVTLFYFRKRLYDDDYNESLRFLPPNLDAKGYD